MKRDRLQEDFENVQKYARYELHATLKGVKLSALALTEEQKERVLKQWAKLKARDVTCLEREAPLLPTWNVTFVTNGRYAHHKLTVQASTPDAIKDRLQKIHKHVGCFHAELAN